MANIRKVGADSWKITVSCGRDANNKQIRHYLTWKPDKPMTEKQAEKAVQKAAYEFEKQINLGFQPDCTQTFSEYARYVIETKKRAGMAARTIELYNYFLGRIDEDFGQMKLVDIRPRHLNEFYTKLSAPGEKKAVAQCYQTIDLLAEMKKEKSLNAFIRDSVISSNLLMNLRRNEPIPETAALKISTALGVELSNIFRIERKESTLSHATISRYHGFISVVFSQAEKEMIVLYNPASRATPPQKDSNQKRSLQPEEVKAVILALEKEPIRTQAIIYTLLSTGCRRGELCALKWSKIDLEKRRMIIDTGITYSHTAGVSEGKTKTGATRIVPLPDELVKILYQYRNWYNLERFRLCGYWQDEDYVFARNNGEVLFPVYINILLDNFSERHNLPHLTPHMFRHTAASLMISEGADVVTVSKILGHKNPTMTLKVYSHEIDLTKENAINRMNDVIRACKLG